MARVTGIIPREIDHIVHARLKARCVVAEDKLRTVCAVADDSHARPDIERLGDAVFSFRDKKNSVCRSLRNAVDRALDGVRVVAHAVAMRAEFLRA